MIFNHDNLAFNVLDVFELSYYNCKTFTGGRNFHALSYRIKSDAVFEVNKISKSVSDRSVSYVPANVDYTRVAEVDHMIVIHFDLFNYVSQDIQTVNPIGYDKCEKYFREILKEFTEKQNGYKFRGGAILMKIFELLYNDTAVRRKNTNIPDAILKSCEYMKRNYTDSSLTIKKLAEMSFMSEAYFRRLFERAFSESPKKYLINLRITHAVSLLHTRYFSISEVAQQSGFNDEKYFSTVFKRVTGKSPTKYEYNFSI